MEESYLFCGFKYQQLKKNLFLFDIVGDKIQTKTNTEWYKIGQLIGKQVSENNQTIGLVSTWDLNSLVNYKSLNLMNTLSSTSFEHEDKTYKITLFNQDQECLLADIMENSYFVFGLNVWIFILSNIKNVDDLDKNFLTELKSVIENYDNLTSLDIKNELIMSTSGGIEMLWLNPTSLRLD